MSTATAPQLVESLGSKKKTAIREDAFTIPDEFLDDFEVPPRPPPPVEKPERPPLPSNEDNFPPPPGGESDGKVDVEIDNLTKLLVKNMEHAGEEGFFGKSWSRDTHAHICMGEAYGAIVIPGQIQLWTFHYLESWTESWHCYCFELAVAFQHRV